MLPRSMCPSADELRSALQGKLQGPGATQVALHLEECDSCAQFAQTIEIKAGELREFVHGNTISAPPDLVGQLKALWNQATVESYESTAVLDRHAQVSFSPPMVEGDLGALRHFRILRHLKSGGMGDVFEAWDAVLDRKVAIKVLAKPSAKLVDMMRRERTLLAALRHKNIVSIYDSGELEDGRPFLVMEFVTGRMLDDYVATQRPTTVELVQLMRDVAAAVGVSHALGIVHRDLKPDNIMVSNDGEPRVLDYGLAKRITGEAIESVSDNGTEVGADTSNTGILGTRGFMSPEQSLGLVVDARTDVYALGTIFHQLIPNTVNLDLRAIIVKCLNKDAHLRYEHATALSADLENWLAKRPVHARSTTSAERLWLWSRRNPAQAGLLIASFFLLALLPALTIVGLYNSRLANSLVATEAARRRAVIAEKMVRHEAYFNRMLTAGQAWREAQLLRTRELLSECDEDHRGWEWHYLNRVCHPQSNNVVHPQAVDAVAVNTQAGIIASGCQDNLARIWDLNDFALKHVLVGHADRIYRLSLDATGRRLATASSDGSVKVWDTATGHEVVHFAQHGGSVRSVLFSADGRAIVSAAKDGRVLVWDAVTGMIRFEFQGIKDGHDHPLALGGPNRQWLVYASRGVIRMWDLENGHSIGSMILPTGFTPRGLAVDPSGKLLAVVGPEEEIRIWHLPLNENDQSMDIHSQTETTYCVAWNSDGSVLATAGMDGGIYLWNPRTGQLLDQIFGHEGRIYGLSYVDGENKLVSASTDHTVRIWNLDSMAGTQKFELGKIARTVAWNPDGQKLYVGCYRSSLVAIDLVSNSFDFKVALPSSSRPVTSSVDLQGRQLVLAGGDMPVCVFDSQTGAILHSLDSGNSIVQAVLFSRNGQYLAAADRDRNLYVWDLHTSRDTSLESVPASQWQIGQVPMDQILSSIPPAAQVNHGIAWSPDGLQVAGWTDRAQVTVWETLSGKVVNNLRGHSHGMNSISWSPDGSRIATASTDRTVRIWDPIAGQQTLVLRGFAKMVNAVAWSPDGQRLAAADFDGTVIIWDGSPLPNPQ